MKLMDIIKEQDAWATKAASGPQKCGLSKLSGVGGGEDRAWDREIAKQNKIDAKQAAQSNKNFLSLSYDQNSFPLDKDERKSYYSQYQQAMQTNPELFADGDGYNSEQKYAIASKMLTFVKRAPQISYSINLGKKFGLGPGSKLEDVVNVINQMGGWGSFMNWYISGGPAIK